LKPFDKDSISESQVPTALELLVLPSSPFSTEARSPEPGHVANHDTISSTPPPQSPDNEMEVLSLPSQGALPSIQNGNTTPQADGHSGPEGNQELPQVSLNTHANEQCLCTYFLIKTINTETPGNQRVYRMPSPWPGILQVDPASVLTSDTIPPEINAPLEKILRDFALKILSHQGLALSDLERNEPSQRNLFQVQTRMKLPEIEPARERLIEEIWGAVVPYSMEQVAVLPPEELDGDSLDSKVRVIADLHFIFESDGRVRPALVPYMNLLRNKIKYLDFGPNFPWVGFGIMARYVMLSSDNAVRMGEILHDCYQHGILQQPKNRDSIDYLEHIILVLDITLLMNDTLSFSPPKRGSNGEWLPHCYWLVEVLTRRKSLDEILGIYIPSLVEVYHAIYSKPSSQAQAAGTLFAVDDLNIKTLKSIGKLAIEWTTTMEDHLRLDLNQKTLLISWFSHSLTYIPRTYVEYSENFDIRGNPKDDIFLSWAFLFATSPLASERNQDLAELGIPALLESSEDLILPPSSSLNRVAHTPNPFKRLLALFHRKPRSNTYERFAPLAPHQGAINTRFRRPHVDREYASMLNSALRQLRHYMDSQKPRDFRQLWNDNRDSLTYYTFWGVILFGGVGILLAFFSLAVGIAQAVAGFKALQLASPPVAVPS